jgi:hypothetical protein
VVAHLAGQVIKPIGVSKMTSSKPRPRHRKPRRQASLAHAFSRAAQLVMAFGYCPIWVSGLLLSGQALTEMNDATQRQAAE